MDMHFHLRRAQFVEDRLENVRRKRIGRRVRMEQWRESFLVCGGHTQIEQCPQHGQPRQAPAVFGKNKAQSRANCAACASATRHEGRRRIASRAKRARNSAGAGVADLAAAAESGVRCKLSQSAKNTSPGLASPGGGCCVKAVQTRSIKRGGNGCDRPCTRRRKTRSMLAGRVSTTGEPATPSCRSNSRNWNSRLALSRSGLISGSSLCSLRPIYFLGPANWLP